MQKKSKKEIKEAIEKLKQKPSGQPGFQPPSDNNKLSPKKTSQRIRKKGV
ncbi:MAG: hypothetical protein U0R49_04210 [Fimbriimonadales bacterium]